MTALHFIHWLAGLIVLVEALNKLERTDLLAAVGGRARAVAGMKLLAWGLLAVGSAGAMATPMIHLDPPSLQDVCVLTGFAVLIVRSRFKEVPPSGGKPESDDFTQTRVIKP